MIRLLDPTNPEDIKLLRITFDEIAQQDHPVYFPEGLKRSFEHYVNLFSIIDPDPNKQMYVSVEISNGKVIRMMMLSTMNKLWTKVSNLKGLTNYFNLTFWYTAPGYTKDNVFDNEVGKLAFDKFIEQGMFTYIAIIKGPRTLKGMKYFSEKMFKGLERIDVYIDKYIDSQEKLDRILTLHPGHNVIMPAYYKNPIILYTGVIKPQFRQYENF